MSVRTGIWLFPNVAAGRLVDAIVSAETSGLDDIWLGDEGPAREPFAVLAAAATRTRRIRLGVGVTNPYLRHPGVAASAMCTIDELAGGGRTVLGIGAGGSLSLAPFGLEPVDALGRVRDALATIDAVRRGVAGGGYEPPGHALSALGMEVYVGARGERLNRLASLQAHGAFLAGLPPFRYAEVIRWCRWARPIDIALYPSVAFTEAEVETQRPQMLWSLIDAPPAVAAELGIEPRHLDQAAEALRAGRERPARDLITDDVLAHLLLWGSPVEVADRLATLVRRHRPASIGLALLASEPEPALPLAAEALARVKILLNRSTSSG